jgi:hypothetical protein
LSTSVSMTGALAVTAVAVWAGASSSCVAAPGAGGLAGDEHPLKAASTHRESSDRNMVDP